GGAADTVNFDLGTAEAAPYLVSDVSGQNNRLLVRDDSLQLSIFPSYSLASTGGNDPSLVVGRASGDVANLILSGASSSTFTNDVTRIANVSGATGAVSIVEMLWTSGNLRVGYAGAGELTIDEAATVASTNASLGHLANSHGTALVNGDATWMTTGEMLIGREGDGVLSILNSGIVINTNASLGSEATGEGTVHVGGPAPSWTVQNTLSVGTVGDGSINFTGGSIITNNVNVGGLPASDGAVSMVTGDWVSSGQLTVGGQSVGPTAGGSGLFRITGGNAVVNQMIVTPNGRVELDGGGIDADVITAQAPTGQFSFTAGPLSVREFNGNLNNQGGTLSPYEGSVINGNYTHTAAADLFCFITGEAANDEYTSVDVSGTASLAGELYFQLNNLYEPDPSEVYTLLSASGLTGAFSNVASGQRVDDANVNGSFLVYYGPGSPFNPNHVVLTSFLPSGPAGDYNNNGIVDAADYAVWRDHLGAPNGALVNDVNHGTIDQDQYNTWKANFGTSGAGSTIGATVPEPATIALFAAGSLFSARTVRTLRRGSV
ncbi:MAG: hypothetical protein AB7U97_23120, partial [Pirellulales bacterium]